MKQNTLQAFIYLKKKTHIFCLDRNKSIKITEEFDGIFYLRTVHKESSAPVMVLLSKRSDQKLLGKK